ncbi:MAG: WXG100 family type VII secretion target [Ruminococcus sp.]|nr:WXG100 family type VII secretion target [Ruminococcus sp.]
MADIVFKFDDMRSAAAQINDIAARYTQAAAVFQNEFSEAVAGWEGASKDKLTAFINGAVNDYMSSTVPGVVTALSELIKANADQMEKADQAIADNIPADMFE